MSTPWRQLDVTTVKLRKCFAAELTHASLAGTLDHHVHTVVDEWAQRVGVSVQPVEGGNSKITKMTGLSNRIEDPLLCARFTTQKKLLEADAELKQLNQVSQAKLSASSPAVLMGRA